MSTETVKKAAESKGTAGLPSAGYEQREALRMRQATLEQEAEILAERMIIGKLDESWKNLDREIVHDLGLLVVTGAREDMAYCWANHVNAHGSQIMNKRIVGWEVVSGTGEDCPESRECVEADGRRQIGDVTLMRIPRERSVFLKALGRKTYLEKTGRANNPEWLLEKGREYGVEIKTSLTPEAQSRLDAKYERKRQIQEAAYTKLGRELEKGKFIPGLEL
ncbi:MAG: hypothetical protein V3V92_06630 [Candidatus Hydrothermarchaeales archaeon]